MDTCFIFIKGQSRSASENTTGAVCKTRIPSTAHSLNSFCGVRYYSKVIPSYDAAAVTNQNISVHFPTAVPKVSKFLPQHCNSVLGQACAAHPNCLVSLLGSVGQAGLFHPSQQEPLACVLLFMLWLETSSPGTGGVSPGSGSPCRPTALSISRAGESGRGSAAMTGSDQAEPNLL